MEPKIEGFSTKILPDPFLRNSCEVDEVNIAIAELLELSELDVNASIDASEFIHACLADARARQ